MDVKFRMGFGLPQVETILSAKSKTLQSFVLGPRNGYFNDVF